MSFWGICAGKRNRKKNSQKNAVPRIWVNGFFSKLKNIQFVSVRMLVLLY